ncbi:DUF6777 domain-containing protein [Streptomyces sp. NPDC057445]|uniref:DUF6777 domain-containing protein n=1 Tax=Streptomyces sp. NPDC057445 TaxID=3346136 RepID=UPI0036B65320
MHRRYARLAALPAVLSAALLVTGCSKLTDSGRSGTESKQQEQVVHLQPAADQGPDPFTPSTATIAGAAGSLPSPRASASPRASEPSIRSVRTVLGSTPGLYGGTRSIASCDVEQQIRFLMSDGNRGRAFAGGVGVGQTDLPEFLRGLTPMILRADARLTGHSYRDGAAQRFQAVLQGGTAVLVDQHGSPRVRCASGSPLASPVIDAGVPEEQGRAWPGYDRERVVVITRSPDVINSFIIADIAGRSWLARTSGSDGEADRKPDVLPAYDPGVPVTEMPYSQPAGPDTSSPKPILPDAGAGASPNTNRQGVPAVPDPARSAAGTGAGSGKVPAPDAPGSGSGTLENNPQPAPVPDFPDGTDPGSADPNGVDPQTQDGNTYESSQSDSDILFGPENSPGGNSGANAPEATRRGGPGNIGGHGGIGGIGGHGGAGNTSGAPSAGAGNMSKAPAAGAGRGAGSPAQGGGALRG